eukprot:TRINITY_DN19442_c0_g1_i1.p1 TRINITY_DN19442_c0_g1~~TRINITY_DN19442_c0_g1_i1.p1  ORF type:complete len:235 (+),score=41.13 TRINITY_DN19442_c0_g1_i1:425-1129(+)
MDSWTQVDYSDSYLSSVHKRIGSIPTTLTRDDGHTVGNLVYYYMLDVCETPYLVHLDLDIALWSRPSFSWVRAAVQELQAREDVLAVLPPTPGCSAAASAAPAAASIDVATESTLISGRKYVMDVGRYKRMLDGAVRNASIMGGPGHVQKCSLTSVHWERYVSCAAFKLGFKKAWLNDCTSAWAVHLPWGNRSALDWAPVFSACVSKGVAAWSGERYNGAPLDEWLKLPCMHSA